MFNRPILYLIQNLHTNLRHGVGLLLLAVIFLSSIAHTSAQNPKHAQNDKRILFLLDCSGSMNEQWEGRSKWELAKELIYGLADSIQQSSPRLQFGVRLFGHQYPKAEVNCKDSQLEVPFSPGNASKIPEVLDKFQPQGWTPIAYSLFLSSGDFPATTDNTVNSIILITDGVETCGGDHCKSGELLQKQHVSLKPFIIGLGIEEDKMNYFDCVGTFINANNQVTFNQSLQIAISQSINRTSAQINLLDANGKPNETNTEITLYDAYSNKVMYNMVHTLQKNGLPDTLLLDPTAKYNMTVHTIPPVSKKNIELTPGRHNIIAVDVPQGVIELGLQTTMRTGNDIMCVVRKSEVGKTLFVQNLNSSQKYLMGMYDLEILTLPRIQIPNVSVSQGNPLELSIPPPGTLNMYFQKKGMGSIYTKTGSSPEKIWEEKNLLGKQSLFLQPGNYLFVFRPDDDRKSSQTVEEEFSVRGDHNSVLKF